VGLIEISLIYYLDLYLLTPYYRTLEGDKIEGLDITQKILLLVIPGIIFSGLTGYIITKTWFGLLYLIFPSLIIWLLIKTIKNPIDYLIRRMEYLIDDKLPAPEQRRVVSADEIASMNHSLSLFLEKIFSSVSHIKETIDNVKTQGKAILSGIEREASSSKQIDRSVSDILASKEETESLIKTINKNNANIEALSNEIESQIKALKNTSKKSIELANAGEDKSESGINKINTFVQKIEEGSKSLEELSSAFEQIKEFNSLMEQISDDTNLLALNASIEATRKEGEDSKGFSVIADEIRKLSNDSASYLEKTKENIKRMREAVLSIVESTEESKAIFEESKSIIQKTGEDLKEISESIGMITNMASQISDILKEGAESTELISKYTKKISALNEKQVEDALSLSKETEEQAASMEDTEIRVRTLISLIDKIKENTDIHLG
jgi:methyl-accepting chemotaxis protein